MLRHTPKRLACSALCALLVMGLAPDGRAESIERHCHVSWWEAAGWPQVQIIGLAPTDKVLLPVAWSARSSDASPPVEERPGLEVIVRASDGEQVPGRLGVGVGTQFIAAGGNAYNFTYVERQLWWEPATALAPGTYTAHAQVVAPEPTRDNQECYYQDFERTVTFAIAAGTPPPPKLTVSTHFRRTYVGDLDYGTDCAGHTEIGHCPGLPDVCCWLADNAPSAFALSAEITPSGLDHGGPLYVGLVIERDPVDPSPSTLIDVVYPVSEGVTVLRESQFKPAPYQLPYPKVPSLCVRARLVDLISGETVASAEDCADTANPEVAEAPTPTCLSYVCDRFDDTPTAEPSPDVVEAVDTVSPGDDGGDAVPVDHDPSRSDQGGCATGEGGVPAWLVAMVLLAGAALRRRRASLLGGRSVDRADR